MQGASLSGYIPTQLGNLTALSSLSLNANSLSGFLPTELGQLPSPTVALALNYNSISGVLPSELGALQARLTQLNVANNELSGTLPSQLGQLSPQVCSLSSSNANQRTNEFACPIPGDLSSNCTVSCEGRRRMRTSSVTARIWRDLARVRPADAELAGLYQPRAT